MKIEEAFDLLRKNFNGYEERPQQLEMAKAIESSIQDFKHIIVEAGTGVGKSIAYLIPAIIHSVEDGLQVIISTYTKTLQNQLVKKDLPILSKIFQKADLNFDFCAFFGSENYLCLRRLNNLFSELITEYEELEKVYNWSKITADGILVEPEPHVEISYRLIQEINREPDLCLGKECDYYTTCFYYKAYEKAKFANLIVINHFLFSANLLSGGRFLPQVDILIFDEAHNLEDVAFEMLGSEITIFRVKRLLNEIYNAEKGRGLLTRLKAIPPQLSTEIQKYLSLVEQSANAFFQELLRYVPENKDMVRVREKIEINTDLPILLVQMADRLKSAFVYAVSYEEEVELKARAERTLDLVKELNCWLSQSDKSLIYWLKVIQSRRKKTAVVKMSPVEISTILRENLFEVVRTVVLTSATLAVNENYSYLKSTLGINENVNELILDSPFDYQKRVMVYFCDENIDPRDEEDKFQNMCCEKIKDILKLTEGNAFVLFTSYDFLDFIYQSISLMDDVLSIIRQGETSRYRILDEFKISPHGVLLGTSSFWQGVDVPGEALICVIITKLPFDVPDHPLVEARSENLKISGKDPFKEFFLPRAILRLKQGFGRLMRRKDDWGVVAILDPRIKTRWYGKMFTNSLPKCRFTSNLKEVANFIKFYKNIS